MMSTLSLRLPTSLHKAAKSLAHKEHVSVNQFIVLAVAEKLSALEAEDYLLKRAGRGDRKKYLAVLKSAPNIEPDAQDKL